jgi:hypothetical protein
MDVTKTPHGLFYKKRPKNENLRVIGCSADVHVPDCKRKKLDSKATHCLLVGYGEDYGTLSLEKFS